MIDYTSQRAIIIGHEVPEVKPYDFFETRSEEQITEVLSKCTERQREELREIARSAPNGTLPIAGAGGTGNTTVTIRLLRAALLQGETALVTSSTNTAVNNIARRAAADMDNEEFLYVRVHPESLEHGAILSYDKRKAARTATDRARRRRERASSAGKCL
jgi:archaellum biogenesis ATPase FlaH